MTDNILKKQILDFITNMAGVVSPTDPLTEWQIDAVGSYLVNLQTAYLYWKSTGEYPRHRPDILYYFWSCAELEGFDKKKPERILRKKMKKELGYRYLPESYRIIGDENK